MSPAVSAFLKTLGSAGLAWVVTYLTAHASQIPIPAPYQGLLTAALVAIAHWLPQPNASSGLSTSAVK